MTAGECDKCGKFLDPSDNVVAVIQCTEEELRKPSISNFSRKFICHVHCWYGIEDLEIKQLDENEADDSLDIRTIREERKKLGEYSEKGTPVKFPVICSTCDELTRTPMLTCPKCFSRRTYEY
jgi:hypothetical protein